MQGESLMTLLTCCCDLLSFRTDGLTGICREMRADIAMAECDHEYNVDVSSYIILHDHALRPRWLLSGASQGQNQMLFHGFKYGPPLLCVYVCVCALCKGQRETVCP